ncbi:calcium-binding protein [Bifidobacterium catulorum]|uniref:Calcium-binding protein n=2 Tax=Bifidobacterium catulorum TaxID=1630173 RepID=A0A2U2MR47_9BIFI|nr:calcium-binding protein [Bifidobacterium catulorum]
MLSSCGDSTGASSASSAASSSSSSSSSASSSSTTPNDATTPNDTDNGTDGSRTKATDALAKLPVKGRAPKTGYTREQFGPAWADVDGNGCDTRNDILARDMQNVTYRSGTHNCVVTSGTLADPYTGRTINFKRGQNTSSAVQIDHVVALSDAWQKGAQQIGADKRKRLANDPYNLLAVDGPANQQKSDGDAATWLPANKSYRCAYVARQIGVKAKYSLWVTQAEHDAMATILATCPTQTVPTSGGNATESTESAHTWTVTPSPTSSASTPSAASSPSSAGASTASGSSGSSSDSSVSYRNCAAVRAAGKAPLHRGDPGYSTKLDRDGDGVACE